MDPSSSRTISIVNRSGRRAPSATIRRALETVLAQHEAPPGEVAILLTEDHEIQDLNRRFRHIDEPTDVLTFPADNAMLLGDIAISVPYADRQARLRGVSTQQEVAFLAIHGVLHLLGFDDETEDDKEEMLKQMNRAATAAGLKPDLEWASILHEATR